MKKLLAAALCLCMILCAAGCSSQGDIPPDSKSTTAPNLIIDSPSEPFHPEDLAQPMHAIVLPSVTETVFAEDGAELFRMTYQKAQLILNGTDVEDIITGDLQSRMGRVISDAADIEALAQADYPEAENWSAYFVSVGYTPTRLDQAVMSLFGNLSSYSGGPHPSLVTDSVTYDLKTGEVLTLDKILREDCTGEALSALIISSLDDVKDELYYDYDTVLKDRFSGDLRSITDWYFSRNGLCFHFSPYDIAPYSSGTVIAEITYSNLSGVLLEQYLPVPIEDATGSMYAESYLQDDDERFTFTADVIVDDNGSDVLIYSDATVTDVRIETGTWYSDGSQYAATSTIFAADSVGIGNAIRLRADLTDEDTVFRLVYRSGDREVSAFIVYDESGDSILLAHG